MDLSQFEAKNYSIKIKNFDLTHNDAKAIIADFKNKIDKIGRKFSPETLLDEVMEGYNIPKFDVPENFASRRKEILEDTAV